MLALRMIDDRWGVQGDRSKLITSPRMKRAVDSLLVFLDIMLTHEIRILLLLLTITPIRQTK
jgi:hypothetical protein